MKILWTFSVIALLGVSPARAQTDDALLHGALVGYVILQGADLAVTMHDLGIVRGNGRDTLREANPIFATLIAHPAAAGAFKMGAAAATSWLLLHNHAVHPKLTFWLAVAADVGYTYVVIHNARLPVPR